MKAKMNAYPAQHVKISVLKYSQFRKKWVVKPGVDFSLFEAENN